MEGMLDLSALFGPKPVYLTVDQLRALNELVDEYDDTVALMVLNDGGATATARVITGTRPIPSESEVRDDSETVISVKGTHFHVDTSDEETYQANLEAALESAFAEAKELIEAEERAQAREAIVL